MMEIIHPILCLIFIIAPLGTFFHELGHAFAARSVHANEIMLKIGKGKRIVSFLVFNIKVEIHILFFIGGHTVSSRSPFYKKGELVFITLFGPLSNGIIALLLFIFSSYYISNIYIELAFWYNIWLFVINIIPLHIQDKCTDGFMVYKLLLKGID